MHKIYREVSKIKFAILILVRCINNYLMSKYV